MINILSAIISGAIIGALARWFYPGVIDMTWYATIALGIGGSLLAGLLFHRGRGDFHQAGCLGSLLGAMALIFAGGLLGVNF